MSRALLGSIGRAKPVDDEPSVVGPNTEAYNRRIDSVDNEDVRLDCDEDDNDEMPMSRAPPLQHRSPTGRHCIIRQDASTSSTGSNHSDANNANNLLGSLETSGSTSARTVVGRRWPPSSAAAAAAAARLNQEALRAALREATAKFACQPALGVTLHCNGADSLGMRHAAALPRLQAGLQRLHELERRLHLLELDRKVANRLRDLALLADQIDRLRDHEIAQLADARRPSTNGRYAVVSSKLGSARALCERLRASLSHSQHVRLYVQASAPLQECLPSARPALAAYREAADRLLYRALASTRAFLQASLSVLARTGLARHTREDLFELCRGLEEFNSTLDQVKWLRRLTNRRCPDLAEFAAPSAAVEDLRPVTFARLINRLAEERAESPEIAVHRFYFDCDGLAEAVADCGSSVEDPSRVATASAAAVALLSAQTCPLTDWLRAEWDFASGLLDCLAQSTQLLPRQGGSGDSSGGASFGAGGCGNSGGSLDISGSGSIGGSHSTVVGGLLLRKDDTVDNLVSGLNTQPPEPQSPPPPPTPTVQTAASGLSSPADPTPPSAKKKKKKGVHWSDYSDVPVRHHVVGKYLELVWQRIDDRFHPYRTIGFNWLTSGSGGCCDRSDSLGCLWLLPPPAVSAVSEAVRVTASETSGLFPAKPAALLPCLQALALRLQLHACQAEFLRAFDRHLALACTPPKLISCQISPLLDPCLRAVLLCCSELSDWLAGRRGGACRVTASQLEPPLAALADWLAISVIASRSVVSSLLQLACRSLARLDAEEDNATNDDTAVDDIEVDCVDDDNDVVCDGDGEIRGCRSVRGRRFFTVVLIDLPALTAALATATAACSGAISPRRLPEQCAGRLRGRLEAFASLPDTVVQARTQLMLRYAERCLSRARRQLAVFFPSAERAWQLAEIGSPPPTSSNSGDCGGGGGGGGGGGASSATEALFNSCLTPPLVASAGIRPFPDDVGNADARLEILAPPVAALAAVWSSELLIRRRRRCEAELGAAAACLGPRAARCLESDVERLVAFLTASLPGEPGLAARLADLDAVRQLRAGIKLLRRRQPVLRTASCGSLPTAGLCSAAANILDAMQTPLLPFASLSTTGKSSRSSRSNSKSDCDNANSAQLARAANTAVTESQPSDLEGGGSGAHWIGKSSFVTICG